jgi:hypothetical protein
MELLMKKLAVVLLLAACGPDPTDTDTVCPDPDPLTLTWENFGEPFMTKYCVSCHAESLTRSKRNGAPLYHDFDSLYGVMKTPDHIDEQAGAGSAVTNQFMPPGRCPSVAGGSINTNCEKPTLTERKQLADWIACERKRPHDFTDAGVDAP